MKRYWEFKNGRKIEKNRENMLNLVCQHWNDMIENKLSDKRKSRCVAELNIRHNCFACDYFLEDNRPGKDCIDCPFSLYENEEENEYGEGVYCENENSPYGKYRELFYYDDGEFEICELFIESE